MADDRRAAAVDILARRMLANGAREYVIDRRDELMEAYRIDNRTYDEVEQRVGQILGSLDPYVESFSAASEFLSREAAGW